MLRLPRSRRPSSRFRPGTPSTCARRPCAAGEGGWATTTSWQRRGRSISVGFGSVQGLCFGRSLPRSVHTLVGAARGKGVVGGIHLEGLLDLPESEGVGVERRRVEHSFLNHPHLTRAHTAGLDKQVSRCRSYQDVPRVCLRLLFVGFLGGGGGAGGLRSIEKADENAMLGRGDCARGIVAKGSFDPPPPENPAAGLESRSKSLSNSCGTRPCTGNHTWAHPARRMRGWSRRPVRARPPTQWSQCSAVSATAAGQQQSRLSDDMLAEERRRGGTRRCTHMANHLEHDVGAPSASRRRNSRHSPTRIHSICAPHLQSDGLSTQRCRRILHSLAAHASLLLLPAGGQPVGASA